MLQGAIGHRWFRRGSWIFHELPYGRPAFTAALQQLGAVEIDPDMPVDSLIRTAGQMPQSYMLKPIIVSGRRF
jgi:hypothetical protein